MTDMIILLCATDRLCSMWNTNGKQRNTDLQI
jgi:hypothetical protein